MNIFKKVRGTQPEVPKIEVNIDTVYIRENVVNIDDDDFKGFEYDEIQFEKNEYIEMVAAKTETLEALNDNLIIDNMMMQAQIDDLILANLA